MNCLAFLQGKHVCPGHTESFPCTPILIIGNPHSLSTLTPSQPSLLLNPHSFSTLTPSQPSLLLNPHSFSTLTPSQPSLLLCWLAPQLLQHRYHPRPFPLVGTIVEEIVGHRLILV